ncbi:hypothetical protein CR513_33909, partial [Mucuna pruriens]
MQTTKTRAKIKEKITHLVNIAEKWITHRSNVGKDHTQSAVSAINLDTKFNMKLMPKLWRKMKKIIFLLQHLIDNGCTNHRTYDKSLFKDLKPTNVSKIQKRNDEEKGTIAISTSLGTKIISSIFYVPNIDQNLISVGQLIEKGFKVSFEHQHCLIYDSARREVLKTTYYTQFSPTELWHKGLGHWHLEIMLNMKKKDMSRGLPILSNNLQNCNAC